MTKQDKDLARSKAATELFSYLFFNRHNRMPWPWEILIAQALLSGELTVAKPPQTAALRFIHRVVDGVELALSLPDLAEVDDAQEYD